MERAPRNVGAMVDEQIKRWELERARRTDEDRAIHPVIAVSRQYGARGAAVAHVVAERLGFSYWNRQIVEEIARHAKVSDLLVRSFDEHHRATIVETVRSMMVGGTLSASEYFRELAYVIHGIAAHGDAVVVGRGVQFLIGKDVLRVRVVAPFEDRLRGLCERRGLTEAAARQQILDTDADRTAFVRDHYGRDVAEEGAYDLHVNTATLGVEASADVIVTAFRARFPASSRSHST